MTWRPSSGRGPKRRRLSRSAEFERVYRQGRSKANRYLVLYVFPREAGDESAEGPRLGLSVSRKVGGAVERTRIKRVLREAFWAEAPRVSAGVDYVVVARADVRGLDEREGVEGVRVALAELMGGGEGARGPDAEPGAAGAGPGRLEPVDAPAEVEGPDPHRPA